MAKAKTHYPRELIADLRMCRAADDGRVPKVWAIVYDGPNRCPNCGCEKGAGWAGFYAATGEKGRHYACAGHDHDRDSQFYPCPVCHGRDAHQRTIQAGHMMAGLTRDDRGWRLDGLRPISGQEAMIQAVSQALYRWTEYGPHGWLALVGPYGSGKTTLAKCLVNGLIDAAVDARYGVAPALYDELKMAYNDAQPGRDIYILRKWASIPVWVLDQLDWLEPHQKDALAKFRALLDARYEARYRSATVLIVNQAWWEDPPKEMGAIRSRMEEGIIAQAECGNVRALVGQLDREGVPA